MAYKNNALYLNQVIVATGSQIVHLTAFEETREQKRLISSALDLKTNTTRQKCALACNNAATCRSFNYCETRICELHEEDIYSTQNGEGILQDDPNCKYFGMKRNFAPKCFNDGSQIDIRNTFSQIKKRRACHIHKKRVDREWSSLKAGFSST